MKILVFGASGMIGSAMFRVLSAKVDWQVWGTVRSADVKKYFSVEQQALIISGVDVQQKDSIGRVFSLVRPDVVINCIGLTKHHQEANDVKTAMSLNALLPHKIANYCLAVGARLIHVSTDCVFLGTKGNYVESDKPDAIDLYGNSKELGEVAYPNTVTLRTSTIGHELQSAYGLLEWFLLQKQNCKGFNKAIFSGLPNTEFANVVKEFVIPREDLHGLYHVGAKAIGKYELLKIISKVYNKQIDIIFDDEFTIDRSLNSSHFSSVTGYKAALWPELIQDMYLARK